MPQRNVIGPVLYILYTNDISKVKNKTIATFADVTAILEVEYKHEDTRPLKIRNFDLFLYSSYLLKFRCEQFASLVCYHR